MYRFISCGSSSIFNSPIVLRFEPRSRPSTQQPFLPRTKLMVNIIGTKLEDRHSLDSRTASSNRLARSAELNRRKSSGKSTVSLPSFVHDERMLICTYATDSPRLYVCHDPYTRDSAFETATATVKQYRTLMRSLPKLSKAPVVNNGKKVSSSKPASFASIFANVPATKGKAKEKDVKSGNANEVALRRALKAKLPAVLEFDTVRPAFSPCSTVLTTNHIGEESAQG